MSISVFLSNLVYDSSAHPLTTGCEPVAPLCERFARLIDSSFDERLGANCVTCPVFDYIPYITIILIVVAVIIIYFWRKK